MRFPQLLSALFVFCLAAASSFGAPQTKPAAQPATGTAAFQTEAPHAILIDDKTGHVFFEKDADTPVPPASMSKLMTQSIVFDMLKRGDLQLDQKFLVSTNASKRGGAGDGSSTMFATPGSSVAIDDLIHGAIIQSANDACIALAEGIAGTEAAFVERMNARAKELGMNNSTFANATGLPDPNEKMSVRDLSIVARYIIANHPDFYKIYSEPEFTWVKITQQNRNPLLKDYLGADGMKTGYTKEAGYGLVGSAVRNGRRLVLVIAGLDAPEKRKAEAQKLLDYGFNQFKTIQIYDKGDTVAQVRVWGGMQHTVGLVVPDAFRLDLAGFEQDNAEMKVTYKGPLMAPLKAGTEVGYVRVLINGREVARSPVQVSSDIDENPNMWQKAADSALLMMLGG